MENPSRDPYRVLGVDRAATQPEIARAYRRLLRRHHPDGAAPGAPPGPPEALADVLAAYRILRDPQSRADYDQRTAVRKIAAPRTAARDLAARDLAARDRADRNRADRNVPGDPPLRAGPVRWHDSWSGDPGAAVSGDEVDGDIDELAALLQALLRSRRWLR